MDSSSEYEKPERSQLGMLIILKHFAQYPRILFPFGKNLLADFPTFQNKKSPQRNVQHYSEGIFLKADCRLEFGEFIAQASIRAGNPDGINARRQGRNVYLVHIACCSAKGDDLS